MRKIALFSFIFGISLVSCSKQNAEVERRFKYDYSTTTVRMSWHGCFNGSMQKNPMLPPPIHFQMCDCMIDKVRENIPPDKVENLNNRNGDPNTFKDISGYAKECMEEVMGTTLRVPST